MLTIDTPYGRTVAAAVPWFVAPFGRDAVIASLETLMLDSRPAVDCVRLLTRLQGRTDNAFREEQPGKDPARAAPGRARGSQKPYRTPPTTGRSTPPRSTSCWSARWSCGPVTSEFFELLRDPIEAALRWIDE